MNDFIIPAKVEKLIRKFRENNAEIYIVGGAVRDLILKREVKDWDFTTNLAKKKKKKIFPKNSFYNNNLYVSESGTIRIKENMDGDEVDASFYLKNKEDVEKVINTLEKYKETFKD